ncbi:MAG: 50S ribosomal protein L32 [Patescibacteria group bacterium]|nr:50S ribosomal protein L32 [Patescibacteria group bacterium]
MSVPKKRKSKSSVRKKRSHQALKSKQLIVCSHCNKKIMPHQICPYCGYYKGKEVINIKLKKERKEKRKKKRESK